MADVYAQRRRNPANGLQQDYWSLRWKEPLGGARRSRSLGFVDETTAREQLKVLEAQLLLASVGGSSSKSVHRRPAAAPVVSAAPARARTPQSVVAPAPPVVVDTPTLRDWLEVRYLRHHTLVHAKKAHVQEVCLASWRATLLGDVRLHELTTNLVEQYKQHRLTTPTKTLKRPVSPRTVNGELRVLSSALRWAAELDVLKRPLPRIRHVPGKAPPKRYLTPDEVERLLDAAKQGDPRTWLLALVLANMGFRPSEAMTREWTDIDWDGGSCGIIRVTHKPSIEWYVKGGRARRGRERSVPMTPTVRDALREAWEAAGRPTRGWVFPGRRDPSGPQKECINGIQAAAKRAGLEVAVHPHLFRHAWASRLAMAGVDRKSLQELGGWSDGRMLDEVYAHVTPDHLGAIMARSGIGGKSG